ncbi:PAS domain S-box protein [Streptomyces sp. R41]|uniref:histidine kinase n=1 Tax=Streptomyces sp. R41 TaxID=3238632 RepID=A0AB39RFJ7_9ACTN
MRPGGRRTARAAGARPPLLARLRVGTKLMLLALLPVAGLLAFTVFSAVAQWHEARTLEHFRVSTKVSFATAGLYEAVALERLTEVLAEAAPDRADTAAERDAARGATNRALTAAESAASRHRGQPDVLGVLGSLRNQLHAVRLESAGDALSAAGIEQRYSTVETYLLDTVRRLDSSRPTRASGRSGDAYLAILGAIEAAERERVELAVLLAAPRPDGQGAPAGRWPALETAQLDTFRQTASGPLRTRLARVLLQPPGRTVRAAREALMATEGAKPELPSLDLWLMASTDRLDALRGIGHDTARELAADADHGLKSAQDRGERELALSVGVLFAVTVLALTLRRSITRPLTEVSQGAKALAAGDLSYDVHYRGRDEIGVVADTFRELHVTSERLAAEIRTMNTAIDDNRLGHRADVAGFDGTWAQLLGGMNDTMASFAAAHGRRREAERELASIFNLSLELLCICGIDGYLKRVNPAFERTLGYPAEVLLTKPWLEFVHPEDRARTRAVLRRLADGVDLGEFENRCLRADGTERWLQWSARPVTGEGLVYAAARDVTESRRADREQAALRRVATLVARGQSPHEVFAAVAREVGMVLSTGAAAVLRYGTDGAVTLLGSAHAAASAGEAAAAAAVAETRRAARAGRSVGAPIVVDDRLWGAVVAAPTGPEPLPPGTESRLADFTELVATAIANADSRAQLTASRARVVAASDASRRRIERDLHDGIQQRLVSLQLGLRMAESMMDDQSAEFVEQLAHISKGLDDAFEDLLQVSRGIHPAILSRGGLGPALRALARRSAVPVELDLQLPSARLPEQTEVAVYYVTSECLTNAAKHAHATVVQVEARTHDDVLEVSIGDDGTGGARPGAGSGLVGLTDRVEAIGGKLAISSPPGSGTTLTVRLPLREPPSEQ